MNKVAKPDIFLRCDSKCTVDQWEEAAPDKAKIEAGIEFSPTFNDLLPYQFDYKDNQFNILDHKNQNEANGLVAHSHELASPPSHLLA